MRHIRIPLLVVALSLMVTGMAFALDLPALTTWTGQANAGSWFIDSRFWRRIYGLWRRASCTSLRCSGPD